MKFPENGEQQLYTFSLHFTRKKKINTCGTYFIYYGLLLPCFSVQSWFDLLWSSNVLFYFLVEVWNKNDLKNLSPCIMLAGTCYSNSNHHLGLEFVCLHYFVSSLLSNNNYTICIVCLHCTLYAFRRILEKYRCL